MLTFLLALSLWPGAAFSADPDLSHISLSWAGNTSALEGRDMVFTAQASSAPSVDIIIPIKRSFWEWNNNVIANFGNTDRTLTCTMTAGETTAQCTVRAEDIPARADLVVLEYDHTRPPHLNNIYVEAGNGRWVLKATAPRFPFDPHSRSDGDVVRLTSSDVTLSAASGTIMEGGSPFEFTLNRTDPVPDDPGYLGFVLQLGGTASPDDYTLEYFIGDTWHEVGNRSVKSSFDLYGFPARFRVTAKEDADETDETVTVSLFEQTGYTVPAAGNRITLTIEDNDKDTTAPRVASITRQSPPTSPTSADQLTWRVTFNEAVQNVDAADFAVTGTTATISSASRVSGTNAYDVTASGGDLADLNATVTLSFASGQTIQDMSGNALTNITPTGSNDNTYVVNNTTPPTPGVTVSESTLSIAEGGSTGSYTVVLDSAPTADVTVTATSGDDGAVRVNGPGGSPGASAALTFTPTDWNQTQAVTVTGREDTDSNDETVTITHTVSNTGGYNGVTAGSVTVTVDDDESANTLPTVATDIPNQSATAGTAFTYQFPANTFNDADGDTLTYTAAQADGTTLPSWLTFTPNTRTFSGTPAASDAGTVTVRVTADDSNGGTVHDDFVITVSTTPPPVTPTLSFSTDRYSTNEGEAVSITVNLRPARTVPTIVQLAYAEGSPAAATGGVDYTPGPESIEIAANATSHTFRVQTTADEVAEPGESFTVTLSAPAGVDVGDIPTATVTIVDDDGVGEVTIATVPPVVSDLMTGVAEASLVRFGRTVAEQALDGIAGRMAAPRTPGMRGSIAGQALSFGSRGPDASGGAANDNMPAGNAAPGGPSGSLSLAQSDVVRGFGANDDRFGDAGFGHDAHGLGRSRTMTAREALLGSSFTATGETDGAGGSLAFWGRTSQASFDGAERGDGTDIALDGTVTAGMLGADYARGKWLVGLALTQSSSEGSYAAIGGDPCPGTDAVRCDGDVEASLTAAIPYAALQVSERLRVRLETLPLLTMACETPCEESDVGDEDPCLCGGD